MQKYLTQHGLKAFTILLPTSLDFNSQDDNLLENDFSIRAADRFLNHFASFVKANVDIGVEDLPTFNFLTVFYDVQFVDKTDELLKFHLVLNEPLNKTMWRRLKHTVFNQYNALIGFSDILSELEDFDDTDRLLIHRINTNVREMFQNTKLYMEFEQLKAFNFELKSRLVSPIEYISSFLRHRHDKEAIAFKYNREAFGTIVLNIDNEYFKASLHLLFDALKEIINLSKASLELQIKERCIWRLEYTTDALDDTEFAYEIQLINDFYNQGIDMKHLSNRMFHLIYIRLIVEKLGGEFNMRVDESSGYSLLVEWIFPFNEYENLNDLIIEPEQLREELDKMAEIPAEQNNYPLELRREIARHFSNVDGVFVLDDWKLFANKLDILIVKYKASEVRELKQIIDTIYRAVKGFDITALQLIMNKLKQITEMK
jgi:hypothetical protein